MTIIKESLYEEYTKWCESTNYGDTLYEGKISDALKSVFEFGKQIATSFSFKIKDVLKLLRDKGVFKFFSELKWDFDSFLRILGEGSKILRVLSNPLQGVLTAVLPDLISKKAVNLKGFKLTKEQLDKFHDWTIKNKKLLAVSAIAFAGVYLIAWLTMSQTGDFTYDFDLSDVIQILAGKLTLFSFLSSDSGLKMMILFFVGFITGGLVTNLLGNVTGLAIALITTLAKSVGQKLSKGKDSTNDMKLAMDSLGD